MKKIILAILLLIPSICHAQGFGDLYPRVRIEDISGSPTGNLKKLIIDGCTLTSNGSGSYTLTCTSGGGGGSPIVQASNVTVVASAATLDFASGLSVNADGTTEADIYVNDWYVRNITGFQRLNSTSPVTLHNAGDWVGLGTSAPTQQLELTRNLRLPYSTSAVGNIFFGGTDYKIWIDNIDNVALGYLPNISTVTGHFNVLLGSNMGVSLTSGQRNVYIGEDAGNATTTGGYNVAIGSGAGSGITVGSNNVTIGYTAGNTTVTGDDNVFIGNDAGGGAVNTASNNIYIGETAGLSTTSGARNTCIGSPACLLLTTGSLNNVIGYNTDLSPTTISHSAAIGNNIVIAKDHQFLVGTTGDDRLDLIGSGLISGKGWSGVSNQNSGIDFNTFTNAWTFSTGTNAWTSSAGDAAFFTINNASSDPFSIRGDGNVGIGNTDPSTDLHVTGGARITGLVSCDTIDTDGNGVLSCGTDSSGGASDVRYDQILDSGNNQGIYFSTFTNTWTSIQTTSDFFTINANSLTTADALNISTSATNTTGDAIEVSRGGTNVFRVDGFGQVNAGSWGGSVNQNSGVTFGAFGNAWTFSTGTNVWTSSAGDSDFFTVNNSSSSPFSLRGDGNVGIGNTDPSTKLHVTGGARITGLVSCDTIDTDSSGVLSCGSDSSGGAADVRYDQLLDSGTNAGLVFGAFNNLWTSTAGDAEFFKVDTSSLDTVIRGDGNVGVGYTDPGSALVVNGDVGIGNSAPSTNLHVTGNARVTGLVSCDTIDTDSNGLLACGTDSGGSGSTPRLDQVLNPGTQSGWNFSTYTHSWTSAATTTDFFTLTGTDLSSGDAMSIVVDNTMTTGKALNILGGASGTSPILTVDDVNVGVGTSAPRGALEILTSGNVGIGNTAPAYKLDVTGAIAGGAWKGVGTDNSLYEFNTFNNTWTFTSGTNIWTSTMDGGNFFLISDSDADNAADTTLLRLNFADSADANSIFIDATDNNSKSVFRVATSGNITSTGTFTGTAANDLGWNDVDGADNTACNTICTSTCAFGILNATGTAVTGIVDCADATADQCMCAGAN